MPELPEVETVARQLAPLVRDRTVVALRVLDPSLKRGRFPRIAGRHVTDVTRSGKRVLFHFSPGPGRNGGLWLAVHLRMTGRLIWVDETRRSNSHTFVRDSVWIAGHCCSTTRDGSGRFSSISRSRQPNRKAWTRCHPA